MKILFFGIQTVVIGFMLCISTTFGQFNQYIKNSTNFQYDANFNIEGKGKALFFDAVEHYQLNGQRILSNNGNSNLFVGVLAGATNSAGQFNTFVGAEAGLSNSIGQSNTFIGTQAGYFTTTGGRNVFTGAGTGFFNSSGQANSFYGVGAGHNNLTGSHNSFFGERAGEKNIDGKNNSFFGVLSGYNNSKGSRNSLFGWQSNVAKSDLNYATAIGASAIVDKSHKVQLGRINIDIVGIGRLSSSGRITLCLNSENEISSCSSSIRYKSNINKFSMGLEIVDKLRPVTFNWKDNDSYDLGFIAEDVGKISPLLISRNDKGQIEAVKYDRINIVLVNAIKEQQKQINNQRRELADLRKLICESNNFSKYCN